ncbi:MAG: NAD(P)H-hydrate dehydratase [Acidobacteriota bacterium]
MRVLSAAEMAAVDRRAIDELGIPGPVLMEHAALGAVEAIADRFPEATRIALFCGPGNNGGDGYAMARLLDSRGYGTDVFRVGRRPRGDALLQLQILERAGRRVTEITDPEALEKAMADAGAADLVVDALFGTGLNRPLDGLAAAAVRAFQTLSPPRLAVDLPSGLDGSRWTPIGPHATADLTVTFAAPKVAHALPPAGDLMGELVLVDLGIPPELVATAPGSLNLTTHDDAAAIRLEPAAGAHKGSLGHVLVIAGARGLSGAAVLATRAAVRGGAGLVTAAVPRSLVNILEVSSAESMTLGLHGVDRLAAEDVELVAAEARGADGKKAKGAVVLGPGLGRSGQTVEAVRRLLKELEVPVVLDADGLYALGDQPEALRVRSRPTILTPHPGEMARLLGGAVAGVEGDRPRAALELAERSGHVAVLKGRRTLIATPGGELWINPTGNPGMATGGTGDVLAGLLGALLGQGYDAVPAAVLAAYIHGLAGDLAVDALSREGLAAGDLIRFLPQAWVALGKPLA